MTNPIDTALMTLATIMGALLGIMCWRYYKLRRRHRACRNTLNRVAGERDQARMDLETATKPKG